MPEFTAENLVSKFLFALFYHTEQYADLLSPGPERDQAKKVLGKILNETFNAIKAGEYDYRHYDWLTPSMVENVFNNRKFNQYYKNIEDECINYRNARSSKLRVVFGALAALLREVFREIPSRYWYIQESRRLLGLSSDTIVATRYIEQMAVLGQIERELATIANKPSGAISFDDSNDIILKVKSERHFPSAVITEQDVRFIEGRFLGFRRLFSPTPDGRRYIREYLVIARMPFGLTVKWETRGGSDDHQTTVEGVAFFTQGGFWAICHSSDPFRRIRVMAGEVTEWRHHLENPDASPFCSGRVLSHRAEPTRFIPESRLALFRRQREDDWRSEPYSERVRFLTDAEMVRFVGRDRKRLVDGE